MTGSEDHIIEKSILKISVSDQETAYQTQSDLLAWFQSEAMPAMELELDRLAVAGQVIQLDKIQLDLGKIDLSKPQLETKIRLVSSFREAIERAMNVEAPSESRKVISQEDLEWERFVTFLNTGRVGWDTAEKQFVPDDLLRSILKRQKARLKAELPKLIVDRRIVERLSLQFKVASLRKMIALINPTILKYEGGLCDSLRILRTLFDQIPERKARQTALVFQMFLHAIFESEGELIRLKSGELEQFEVAPISMLRVWMAFFDAEGAAPERMQIENILLTIQRHPQLELVRFLKQLPQNKMGRFSQAVLEALELSEPNDTWCEFVKRALPKAIASLLRGRSLARLKFEKQLGRALAAQLPKGKDARKMKLSTTLESLFGNDVMASPKLEHEVPTTKTKSLGKKKAALKEAHIFLDDAQYIENAGIVLLNPFFQPCFEDLGWMGNGAFKDRASQEDAVMLLAYLATGAQEVSEASLPLMKVLCGLDLDEPIRAQVDLPSTALKEAETLLVAANAHWEKTGKLAPDQFREAFLQREGRLKTMETGINLKVDRQTIDILLEFLPWSFGTIMMPWMKKIVTVDW